MQKVQILAQMILLCVQYVKDLYSYRALSCPMIANNLKNINDMTNKFFSSVDGNHSRVASDLPSRCSRLASLSIVSRQSDLRTLLLCLTLFTLSAGQMWAKEGDVLKTYNTNSSTFKTGYKRQSGDNFVWWGQQNYLGANNATNHGNLKPTAADLPVVKAQNASATTSTTGLYYCYTSEAVANVGALEITFSAKSGSSTVNAYIVTSSTAAASGSATWTKVTLSASSAKAQGANVANSGTYRFTFNATETGSRYYGVVFATSSYWRATGFQMKLIEGATSSKTLSSISVQTAPTKVKYVAGENFDPTGLIITRNYSSGSPDTYTYASHTSEFTFSPTTATALTTSDASVSITYGGKSTSQAINVYNVTMQARDEDGNAIPSGGPVAPTRSGKSITPAADANNYVFKEWSISGASLGSSKTTKSNTITSPTGAVTVTAVYYKPITVSWNKNGSLHATTYTGYNQKPVFPANPSSCDATSNTFYGWATGTWDDPVDNLTGKTVYTSASSMPDVTGTVTYHAVFAKVVAGSDYELITDLADLKAGDAYLGSYINYSGWRYYAATSNSAMTNVSTTGTPLKLSSTTGLQKVTFVETATSGQFQIKNSNNKYLYANGAGSAPSWSDTECAWIFSNKDANNLFKIKSSLGTYYLRAYATSATVGALKMYGSETNSGLCVFQASTSYSKYITSCCTELVSINGSFNRYHLKIFHHIIMSMFISLIFKC